MLKRVYRLFRMTLYGILAIIITIFVLLLLDRDYVKYRNSTAVYDLSSSDPKLVVEIPPDSVFTRLLEEYGQNKSLAPGYEVQCLVALSYYPELKEAPIDFVIQPAFLPLASRPDPWGILFPWKKRRYLVVISNESTDFFDPILLQNTPFNEQVGVIGHELGHTLYYLDRSALQMARIAYLYQFDNDYRHNFERETDKRAVAHGLGYQVYDFAIFARKAFGNSLEEIRVAKDGMYLSPGELAREMDRNDIYQHFPRPLESYFGQ